MDHQFECTCGYLLSDDTNEGPSADTLTCPRCGAMYAVTITQLRARTDSGDAR